uniref:Amino acid transporter transmembrane domain-containing protein n=1 Tax=Spongospora subterranea TaxID=70186 RepID=A0A0H5QKM5_9EUKA|eukprot:CRZ02690.1 hypothetical protein [Spongospora subterranea]
MSEENRDRLLQTSVLHARTVREKYMMALGYRSLKLRISEIREESDAEIRRLPHFDPRLTPRRRRIRRPSRPAFMRQPLLEEDEQDEYADEGETEDGRIQEEISTRVPKRFMSAGSMHSSVFNLSSAALGAGILSVPYAFRESGFILGIGLMVLSAAVTIYSINLLVCCRDETRLSSYEDLSVYCFGKRLSMIVDLSIILFCFGCGVAYIVATHDILAPIIRHQFPDHPLLHNKGLIMSVSVTAIMFPLSLVEKMSSLRFSSLLGVLSISYLVFAIVYDSAVGILSHGLPPLMHYAIRPGWSVFRALSIIMFAFTCQVNVFSIYTELQRPSIRRIRKVVRRSTSITSVFYLLVGLFGFLKNLDQTSPDILYNYNLLQQPIIGVAQVAMGVTLALAFPFNIYPCRFTIEMSLFPDAKPSRVRFHFLTFAIVYLSLLVAIFAPSLDKVFSLLGSTTSSVVSFILPALFYLHIFPGRWSRRDRIGALTLLISGCLLCVIGTTVELLSS